MKKLVRQTIIRGDDSHLGHDWETTSEDGSSRCSRCDLRRLTLGESDLAKAIALSDPNPHRINRKYLYYFEEWWEGIHDLPTNLEVTCEEVMMRRALQ